MDEKPLHIDAVVGLAANHPMFAKWLNEQYETYILEGPEPFVTNENVFAIAKYIKENDLVAKYWTEQDTKLKGMVIIDDAHEVNNE